MPSGSFFVGTYFLFINLVAIILTVVDKYKARFHRWRISEATLFGTAALGGAASMYIAMRLIHHKTRHRRFMWGLPVIVVMQLAVVLVPYVF